MLDVIIIGAGPTGIACGIEAEKANLSYLILEKGGITDAIRRFPLNMTFFSTPELLELGKLPFSSVNVRPTRLEVLTYYRRVVEYFSLNLSLHTKVTQIKRDSDCGFTLQTHKSKSYRAKNVILATGYFDFTNRLHIPGEDLGHVSHFYTEPYMYAGSDIVVIGGRNSAVETALDLFRNGAKVTMVHRGSELGSVKYWILPDIDNRIKEGSIKTHFDSMVTEIRDGELDIISQKSGQQQTLKADFVLALIGYRPDEELLRNAGVELDEKSLIPTYNIDTFETNESCLYIAGSVACGCETWNIFIENGRAHAKPIIDNIVKALNSLSRKVVKCE